MTRRAAIVCLILCLGLVGSLVARADDVPDNVRKFYDRGKAHYAAGDLKSAFSTLSKAKSKAPDSVDFWQLYVKVYRGLGKKENVLWGKTIAKVEAKHPASPNFHLLRYRLASDFEERVGHLKAAIAKAPEAVEPQLMLAREYLRNEDETEAEEILDTVLEKHPGNETALITKGDLMIESGFSRSAIEFAEEALQEHDLPGLHDLAARGHLIVAENDESALPTAAEHAKKAVAARPDPGYVVTYARILDLQGETKSAVAALSDSFAKTSSPLVAGYLGELAFRTGDYAQAVKGLRPAAPDVANAAKALLECEARRGRAKEARAALKHVLALDKEEGWQWAVGMELDLGDPAAALKHAEGQDEDEAAYAKLVCLARLGKVPEASAIAKERAKDGSRDAEEWLLLMATARVSAALAGKAPEAWKALVEARWSAGKARVASAEVPDEEVPAKANSFAFMHRFVSYRRALDGSFFEVGSFAPLASFQVGGKTGLGQTVTARSRCKRDPQRVFPFNVVFLDAEGDHQIKIDPGAESWAEAKGAFESGCAAFVAGDWAKADEAFAKAVENEPSWARAKLFQAAAKAVAASDLKAAAALAKEAAQQLPDDWTGRRLAILIRILAGEAPTASTKALAEHLESYAVRRYDEF